MMEYLKRFAVHSILVGYAKYAHRHRASLCNGLRNDAAKASVHTVFLNCNYASGLTGRTDYGIRVGGFKRVHIYNARAYALGCKATTGLQGMVNGLACTYYSKVCTVLELYRLAYFILEIVVLVNIGHGVAANTDVNGVRIVNKLLYELARLTCVARQNHLHSGESAQHCYVVKAVMGRAKCSISHTSADAQDFNGLPRIGYVNLYLLKTAGYIETRRAADKHLLAARSQSRSNAYGILLGYTALNKLFGKLFCKVSQRYRTTCIGCYGYYILVFLAKLQHRVGEALTASYRFCFHFSIINFAGQRALQTTPKPLDFYFFSSSILFVISSIASQYSSSVGTPWCHLSTFSM